VSVGPENELPHELRAVRENWLRKWVKDAYPVSPDRVYGVVHDLVLDDDGRPRLLARFPGEEEDRRIALEPVPDGHYLDPADVKARYRRPSELDRAALRRLAEKRQPPA